MNLRCFYCQTPFTLGRAEILAALQQMDAENMNHYDAHCPRCRRANSVSRQRLETAMPNWREVASEQAAMPPAQTEIVPAPVTDIQPVESMPLAPAPKAKPSRKRAGSTKKAAPKVAVKATSSPKGKKPAAAKKKPAAASKSTKTNATTKSKKK
jgi:hypothetical protein